MPFFDLSPLLDWISLHPRGAGTVIFLVSLAESLAIVGLFIPGTVVMFGVGALIAAGALDIWMTLGLAAAGAVVGDGVSYWLGRHYHERLRVMWPFSRYPQFLVRGEAFFHRHGGKSVLLGRFVGPVRPVIPMVAGMLNMAPARFVVANVLSALGWAPAYILPGVVFGASLGLAAAVAGRLAVLVVGLVVVLGVTVWAVRRAILVLQPRAEVLSTRLLAWSRAHPRLGDLTAALVDPQHPESRGLLIWAGLLVLAAWLFLDILVDVVSGDPLVQIDSAVFHLLQGLRTPWADQVMVFITELGDRQVIVAVVVAVLGALCWQRHWHAALHWLAATAFGALLTQALKQVLQLPRPVAIYEGTSAYSFPSSHATLSMVTYGFLAVLIARTLPASTRWIPYAAAGALIMAISVSRLYLGVHWLSDVLGGLALGLSWVALLGIAYARHAPRPLDARLLSATALLALMVATGWHVQRQYDDDLERYALRYSVRTLDAQAWWRDGWRELPAYRMDLQGQPAQPLNVQWAGTLSDLRAYLEARGWRVPVTLSLANTLQWLVPNAVLADLPVLPQVHDGRHEALRLVYPLAAASGQPAQRLVLRLWPADAALAGTGTPLWVGNVTRQHRVHPLPLLTLARSAAETGSSVQRLRAQLDGLAWRWVRRSGPGAQAVPRGVLLLQPAPRGGR